MKYLMFIISIAFLVSCTKSKNAAKPTSNSPTVTYGFMPNFKQDTLYSVLGSASATQIDTILTFKTGDTSFVTYKGQKLYLFYCQIGTGVDHSDSALIQINCFLNTSPFDTVDAWAGCTFTPYKYYSKSYSEYKYQNQVISLSKVYPHFDTANGSWYEHL